jgi:putative phage-type endonuclease
MERSQWLAERKTGIGGSDIAALFGLHPYKCSLDVYVDKLNLVQDQEDNEAMKWGRILESPIADAYSEIRGGINLIPGEFSRHSKFEHVIGTPDRIAPQESLFVEIKTAGVRSAHRWSDDRVPDEYFLQCHHYMLLTGLPVCDLAVLIGGSDFRIHRIEADNEIQSSIADTVERFWRDHISKMVPPQPDESERSSETLRKLYPHEVLDMVEAPEKIATVDWPDLMDARAKIDLYEAREREAKNKIMAAIGDHSGLVFPDGGKVTWKANEDSSVVDFRAIVSELAPPVELIERHTTIKPGARVFRVTPSKGN